MSDRTSGSESPKDFGTDAEGVASRWLAEIEKAQKESDGWWDTCRAILERYRNEGLARRTIGPEVSIGMKMNILWSNIQTLAPAIYAATPDPVVQRRYGDEDDVGRVASTILQRAISYQLEENDFDQVARECVLDNLIAGRGTVWIRYEPHFGKQAAMPAPVPPMPAMPPAPPMPLAGPAPVPGPAGLGTPSALPQTPLQTGPTVLPPGLPSGPLPPAAPLPPAPGQSAGPPPPTAFPPSPISAGGLPPPGALSPAPAAPLPPPAMILPPGIAPPPLTAGGLPPGGLPIGNIMDQGPDAAKQRPRDGGLQIADDGEQDAEFIAWEQVKIDHVGWEDWLTNPARTWAEVRWVARRAFMTRDELAQRFGPKLADDVPLTWHPRDMEDAAALMPKNQLFCRAQVWEIWDKPSRKVYWLASDYGDRLLDERDDPLRLPGFWPTPRPLYATLTTDSLIPVPDYSQYRDQAVEIDNMTARIHAIGKAIKVAGVYDASQDGVQRMFSEGVENQLIPINQWTTFAEQGGLKGAIDLLDIGTLTTVLGKLVEIRAQAKQDLYEVTGISDIIRGTTAASETATAQQIKSQFGTMRLRARQGEVARFCRDIIRLVADVMCEHFTPRTLIEISDIGQAGAPGSGDAMLVPQAIALLKDDKTRPLRIDIETDSTILSDQQAEQQSRVQFLQMAGQFLQQALPAAQQNPQLAPLLGQMLLFGIRAFPAGAELENAFEQAVKSLEQGAQQPAPPPPDPKMLLAQAQVQNIQSQIANRNVDNQRAVGVDQARLSQQAAKLAIDQKRAEAEGDRADAAMFHDHAMDRAGTLIDAAKVAGQIGRRPI